jgi:signal transduction histidine kinase
MNHQAEFAEAGHGAEELLAVVCHELRSPVAAVRYAARLWSSQASGVPGQRSLQSVIERQTGRMTRLIDDLLDTSLAMHGRMQLDCKVTDLRRVVEHAIETVASEMDACGHQLTLSLPSTPLWVKGDPFRLEQVFVNLLGNAIKYTEHGGRLDVIAEVRNDEALVSVRDSGIGISPQLLPHVFDLFRRADEVAAKSRPGLGIGLALVRTLVELHHGSVTATSRGAAQGSEFTVRLPRID